MRDIFTNIYKNHLWGGTSRSGTGSDLGQTEVVRRELPKLIAKLHVKSLLDIPCGDMHWMSRLLVDENLEYIGADIVPELIDSNINKEYPSDNIQFRLLDITTDPLPEVDLVLCRDLLGHFSRHHIVGALDNVKRSASTYLLATTFPDAPPMDIPTGSWHPVDMSRYLGPPIMLVNEGLLNIKGENTGKSLGLWKIN